ncbi:acyl-CoA dehydrogenase [Sinomicrobium weinanense]|uniref:acyl-CoA oxidase n=1 Tax=Sinomicrobium weinanense TaxID=2842200 RepID=A0A926Q4D9_9FLAO|nr:acyl-CoA dehydrogenase [Sinomicrobium weinanense]MBC9798472.1 acyl-CoA dehydrogenase family protein [Sinomicrobium weinanense]MBU3123892.1 acyl-CoA dehydrogenase family protein [Sinomicrobium weinanense]
MDTKKYAPGIVKYIPFLYVVWADNLLSASEISVFKKAVENDTLTQAEKDRVNSWLRPGNPPEDEVITSWKQLIDASGVKLLESDNYPLTAFSQRLFSNENDGSGPDENLKFIEINLGIQPNHYRHLFDVRTDKVPTTDFYDPLQIDLVLKGAHAPHIDKFRKLLSDPLFQWNIQRDKDAFRIRTLEQVKLLASHGYGAMAYDKAYGGIGNMPAYAGIFENLMYVDGSLTIKFGVQFGLFGGSIQNLGTKKHHDQWLKATGEAKILGCFAMTETGHGSNVRGIKTTATYVRETGTIVIDTPGKNDNKEYIGNALHARMATVFAQLIVNGTNEGVHAILVPVRDENGDLMPGVRIEDNGYKLGLNGVDNGKIWFSNVSVPRENLLDRFGRIDGNGNYQSDISNPNKRFFTMLGTLVGGRICVAKGALSGAKMALAIAVKYALYRRQFNSGEKVQEDLIMDYPSHQLRLIAPIALTYVYHITLDHMIRSYASSTEETRRQTETQAAALKALITDFSNTTIQECREACGGKGYLLENRIGDLKNDVDIFTTFEGDNTVLLQLAAKGVLTDFKSEFNSDHFGDILKLLGTQLSDRLTTFNPLFTNNTDKDHLFDPGFHLEALQYRTRRLTFTAASRIRSYLKKGVPSQQVSLNIQTHLITLGKTYGAMLSYEIFSGFVENMADKRLQFLFRKLGALYALMYIRDNAAWYLEHGYISSNKSKAIRQRVERLCTELRPHVASLVDGYGIPEHCLTAPIGKK